MRLFGIDTPESRTRDKEEKVRGLLAKKYLQEALKKGTRLTVKTYKDYETPFNILHKLFPGTNFKEVDKSEY